MDQANIQNADMDDSAKRLEDWSNPKYVNRHFDICRVLYEKEPSQCAKDLSKFGGFARLVNNCYAARNKWDISLRYLAYIADIFHEQLPEADLWGPDYISGEAFAAIMELDYDSNICWMMKELLKGMPQGVSLAISQEKVAKAMQSEIRDAREIVILAIGEGKIVPTPTKKVNTMRA